MRKFIIYILLFLSPLIFSCYLLDIFISKQLKRANLHAQGEYPVWNSIIDGEVNSDIVIYGSSTAWVQFNPTMIGDSLNTTTYNLGIDGHNFWLQYLRHKLLLKHNNKPKLIIHSVDNATLQKRTELYNPDQFLPYMLWNNDIENAIKSYKGYTFLDFKIPLIRYFGKTDAIKTVVKMMINQRSNVVVRVRGYNEQDIQWNDDFDEAKKTMKYYKAIIDTPSIILFDKYLKECVDNKINVIFVYPPEFIEGQNFIINRDEIINLYKYYSEKYNILFIDFSNDSISFQKQYFYNSIHLNKKGSELFTNKLIARIKGINLNQSNYYN
ncbi:MAG: hypothetical protein ABIJ97_07350 [Bacteroidota bacterium]